MDENKTATSLSPSEIELKVGCTLIIATFVIDLYLMFSEFFKALIKITLCVSVTWISKMITVYYRAFSNS